MLILHGIILRVRPKRSAKKYQQIWTEQGSPLLHISRQQAEGIQARLKAQFTQPIEVVLGMRYGTPSISEALTHLREKSVQRLIVLPLYPQYASAVTASTYDAVFAELKTWRWIPDLRFISHYHDHPAYIQALAQHIHTQWETRKKPEKLIFSFHGMPKRFFTAGDPYFCECHKTARLVAENLNLKADEWKVCFQSRFGREEWLKPYTDETLVQLAQAGTQHIDVVCPGFSADCLETLEEIDQENRELFLNAGGKTFHYISALNTLPTHLDALTHIISTQLQGCWSNLTQEETQLRAERAKMLGCQT
jgi:ferrochelatase